MIKIALVVCLLHNILHICWAQNILHVKLRVWKKLVLLYYVAKNIIRQGFVFSAQNLFTVSTFPHALYKKTKRSKRNQNNVTFYLLNKEFALCQFPNESALDAHAVFFNKLKKYRVCFSQLLEIYLKMNLKSLELHTGALFR